MESEKNRNLERRRAQNRQAQRRFRQRRERSKAQADDDNGGQKSHQLGTSSHAASQDRGLVTLSDTHPSPPSPPPPVPNATDRAAVEVHIQHVRSCRMGMYGEHTLLDSINSVAMDDVHISYFPMPPAVALPATPLPLDELDDSFSASPIPNDSAPLPSSTGKKDDSGWVSPLHLAVQRGHHSIVRMLLQQNIDCDERDGEGSTPLIHATILGHQDIVSSLLSHGARLSCLDNQRRSAIHWAVLHGREALLGTLLRHCSNCGSSHLLDLRDVEGKTALLLAIDTGFEAAVQALLEFGASAQTNTRNT